MPVLYDHQALHAEEQDLVVIFEKAFFPFDYLLVAIQLSPQEVNWLHKFSLKNTSITCQGHK